MKIRAIETVRAEELPNLVWILVHTDEGVTGLGETFLLSETVEAYLHEHLAPRAIGRAAGDSARYPPRIPRWLSLLFRCPRQA